MKMVANEIAAVCHAEAAGKVFLPGPRLLTLRVFSGRLCAV